MKLIGFSLFPKAGIPQFLITVETPRGSNIAETDRAVKFVESVLSERPEINYYMSNIGKGNPMIYYNSFQKSEQSILGEVMCELKIKYLPEIENIIDDLRDTLNSYVNARIYVNEFENGMPVDAAIKYYAGRIEDIIRETEGTTYIKNPLSQSLTDIKVTINTEKAGMFGIPAIEIDRTIRLALAGINVGKYRTAEGKEYLCFFPLRGPGPFITACRC